jgi:DnaJ-class molecular chaperone
VRSSLPRDPEASEAPDHWQILGIRPGADAAALKRAFRAQARRWHPDLNGNDPIAEERFKQVNEAYAVLSDPQRRSAWERGEDAAGAASVDPFVSGFPAFEDYLAELDGTSRRRSGATSDPYPDAGWQEPAASESQRPAGSSRRQHEPPAAEERGWVAAAPPSPPPVQAAGDAESLVELTPEQALQGETVELELEDGTVVEVRTPPLAGDGWRLRLAGVTPGGGDHFLQLRVRTPEGLRIDGLRVLYPLDLSPADAVLGCQVIVPTLEGPVRLRVPAGSSSGRLLRLRGRGQRLAERRGDQLVEVRISVDAPHGEDELALYRRLQELERQRVEDADS